MKLFKSVSFAFPRILAEPIFKVKLEASIDAEIDTERLKRAFGVKPETKAGVAT